jgi:hypothetical protein
MGLNLHDLTPFGVNPPASDGIPIDYSAQGRLQADKTPSAAGPNTGGVYAAHLTEAGVSTWHWTARLLSSRCSFPDRIFAQHANTPKSISSAGSGASLDNSDWGMPVSRQVSSSQRSYPQRLVLDIDLAGYPYVVLFACLSNAKTHNYQAHVP